MSTFDTAMAGVPSLGCTHVPTMFGSSFGSLAPPPAPSSPQRMPPIQQSQQAYTGAINDNTQNSQLAALIAAATSLSHSTQQIPALSPLPSLSTPVHSFANSMSPIVNTNQTDIQSNPIALTTSNGTIFFSNLQQMTPVIITAAQGNGPTLNNIIANAQNTSNNSAFTPNNPNMSVIYVPNMQQQPQQQQQQQLQQQQQQQQQQAQQQAILQQSQSLLPSSLPPTSMAMSYPPASTSLSTQNALQLLQANLLAAASPTYTQSTTQPSTLVQPHLNNNNNNQVPIMHMHPQHRHQTHHHHHTLNHNSPPSRSTFLPHLPPPPATFTNQAGMFHHHGNNGNNGSSSSNDGSSSRSTSTSPQSTLSAESPLLLVGKPSAFRPRPKRDRSDPTDSHTVDSPNKRKLLPSPPIGSVSDDNARSQSGNGNEADDENESNDITKRQQHGHHITQGHPHHHTTHHVPMMQQPYSHHLRNPPSTLPQHNTAQDAAQNLKQPPLLLFSPSPYQHQPQTYPAAFPSNVANQSQSPPVSYPPNGGTIFPLNTAHSLSLPMKMSNTPPPQSVSVNTITPTSAAVPATSMSQSTTLSTSSPSYSSIDDVSGVRRNMTKAKRAYSDDASNSSNSEDAGSSSGSGGGSGSGSGSGNGSGNGSSSGNGNDSGSASGNSGNNSTQSNISMPSLIPTTDGTDGSTTTPQMGGKKLRKKHIVTDRQRRAKIKDGMEQLRGLLSIHGSFTTDQVSIMISTVQLINRLRADVMLAKTHMTNMKHELDSYKAKFGALPASSTSHKIDNKLKDKGSCGSNSSNSSNSRGSASGNDAMNVNNLEALLVQSSAGTHHNAVPVTLSMSLDGMTPASGDKMRSTSSPSDTHSTDSDPPSDPTLTVPADFVDDSDADSSGDQQNSNTTSLSGGDESLSSDPTRSTESPSTETSTGDNEGDATDPDIDPPVYQDKPQVKQEVDQHMQMVDAKAN